MSTPKPWHKTTRPRDRKNLTGKVCACSNPAVIMKNGYCCARCAKIESGGTLSPKKDHCGKGKDYVNDRL
jgi:hypothetical protein